MTPQGVVDGPASPIQEKPRKLPRLTVTYWIAKILATTLGEVLADLFTQTLDLGYRDVFLVMLATFLVSLMGQLLTTRYVPPVYWMVIISSSLAGTCLSDFIDRTAEMGYAAGMGMLLGILIAIFIAWRLSGHSQSVVGPMTRAAEFFYWGAVIVSNTLGTALGDFTADNLHLGFAGGAGLHGGYSLAGHLHKDQPCCSILGLVHPNTASWGHFG
ncbi:unnamed protein product [Polarella glacialis]|uniref:Uncharacterized protein n=1 Tax=Polarella glacialis TaxID=89957 RepID=A0A813LG89_POLGL|nr:unnamed protein product [Polarella glacialis]